LDLSSSFIPAKNKEWFARDILSDNTLVSYWNQFFNLPRNAASTRKRSYEKKGYIVESGKLSLLSIKEKNELKDLMHHTNV